MAFTLPAILATNWANNIGQEYDADAMNAVGAMANAIRAALVAFVNGAAATTVATSESTTSATYADLTTTDSVACTVGASGKVLVLFSAEVVLSAWRARMSYAMTGANTAVATDAKSAMFRAQAASVDGQLGRFYMETGLNPGATTFNPQFRADGDTTTKTFSNRQIAVIPWP